MKKIADDKDHLFYSDESYRLWKKRCKELEQEEKFWEKRRKQKEAVNETDRE